MGKTAKRWWTILLSIPSIWAVIQYVRSFILGSVKIIGTMEFHPPFFLLLAMLCFAVIIAINYSWISQKLKTDRQRFYECYFEIRAMREVCIMHLHPDRGIKFFVPLSKMYANAFEISGLLVELGIKCPDINPNHKDFVLMWFNFVARLVPLARNKDLKSAQRCLEELNELEKENKS